jgi:hypothetical protein
MPYRAKQDHCNPPIHDIAPGVRIGSNEIQERISRDKVLSLATDGFVNLGAIYPDAVFRRVLEATRDQLLKEGATANQGYHYQEPGVTRMSDLVEKDAVFLEMAANRTVLAIGQLIVGQSHGIRLSLMNYRSPRPGAERQDWHGDANRIGALGYPSAEDFTAILYLADTAPSAGDTIVLPGSHRYGFCPSSHLRKRELSNEMSISAKAGDVVILNGYVWHCGGENRSGREAPRILMHFKSDGARACIKEGIVGLTKALKSPPTEALQLVHYRPQEDERQNRLFSGFTGVPNLFMPIIPPL